MIFPLIFLFLLVALLSFMPNQNDSRIITAIALGAIFCLPIFFKRLTASLATRKWPVIFFLLFLLSGLASTLFSINKGLSLPYLILYIASFVIFLSAKHLFENQDNKTILAGVLIYLTSLLAFVSLYNTLVLHYINRQPEGVSFLWIYFGHNHLSALLIFSIPLSFYFLKTYWNKEVLRLFFLFTIFYLLFALYFTFARASMIALLSAFALAGLLLRFIPKQAMLGFTLSLFVLIVLILASSIKPSHPWGVSKTESLSRIHRIFYWRQSIDNFLNRPIVGSGLNTFRLLAYQNPRKSGLVSDYAHNFFLQILSDAGILGFVSGLCLIFSVLWYNFKKIQVKLPTQEGLLLAMFWVGLLASTLNSLVDFDWQLPTVFFTFWLIAGMF